MQRYFLAAGVTLTLLIGVMAQPAAAADPDDWTYVAGSCDTNVAGVSDDLSGVTADETGMLWAVENDFGSILALSGTPGNQTATFVSDPNNVLTGYDTEGIAFIDRDRTPGGAPGYFAVAWEKNPGDTVESGMTIVQLVGGVVTEVATVSLPGISNGTGNRGLEGIAFALSESSGSTWVFYGVKEEPAELFRIVYDVATGTATTTSQGSLAVADAAGIVLDPTDPNKAYVLTEAGTNVITEVNLSDASTVSTAGVLNPAGDGCFGQPEGLTTTVTPSGLVDIVVVGEADEIALFSIDYASLVAIPASCGLDGCASVRTVALADIAPARAANGATSRMPQMMVGLALVSAAAFVATGRRVR